MATRSAIRFRKNIFASWIALTIKEGRNRQDIQPGEYKTLRNDNSSLMLFEGLILLLIHLAWLSIYCASDESALL